MPSLLALLSTAMPLKAGAEVHLVPAGEFKGRDGRPGPELTWKLPNDKGRELAQRLTLLHKRVAFQFDYEHQSFLSETNGQPAPSAGWSNTFAWKDDDGLYATAVCWTKRAGEMIDADEYRYISPAIRYDKATGVVTGVVNASLVNMPSLEELAPVAQAVARLGAELFPLQTLEPEMTPLLKAMLAALGLTESATENEATSAIATLRAKADRAETLGTEVATLKAATPDVSKFVPMERFTEISGELATLKSTVAGQEVEKVITDAKAAGKVVSDAVEKVWRDVGKTDITQLRALVDGTPGNPALAGLQQTGGRKTGAGGDAQLSTEELAVCKATGIDPKDFLATRTDAAAA